MSGKIIIVTGALAGGKSTFAVRLSSALNVPYLIKDTFKNALCENVPITSQRESSRFSAVTFDAMMYVTERMLERACPIIIEGNFVPRGVKKTDEAGTIKALIVKYGCRPLTYKFTGDMGVLHERFIRREKLPERGRANMMFSEPCLDEFIGYCRNLEGFDVGGETVTIDATDFGTVDFDRHIETARLYINS